MPPEQRGSVYRTARGFGIRWLENGQRQHHSGFTSRTAARNYYRDTVAPRLRAAPILDGRTTLEVFVQEYLAAHALDVSASTIVTLRERLRYATRAFGDVTLADLERRVPEIAAWRSTLPEKSRYQITAALRQALNRAVAWGAIQTNPAARAGSNPEPKRPEIVPCTADEVGMIAAELGPRYASLVRFAAATGLRPSEWIALRRSDVRLVDGVVLVERSYTERGGAVDYGKTVRSRRRVPLSRAALQALEEAPRRIDTQLVFPAAKGGYLDLHNWRERWWRPALDACGMSTSRRIYDLRHTFATDALHAGLSIFELARYMGTSAQMIDRTYGHLARGSEAIAREKLDTVAGRSGV